MKTKKQKKKGEEVVVVVVPRDHAPCQCVSLQTSQTLPPWRHWMLLLLLRLLLLLLLLLWGLRQSRVQRWRESPSPSGPSTSSWWSARTA